MFTVTYLLLWQAQYIHQTTTFTLMNAKYKLEKYYYIQVEVIIY